MIMGLTYAMKLPYLQAPYLEPFLPCECGESKIEWRVRRDYDPSSWLVYTWHHLRCYGCYLPKLYLKYGVSSDYMGDRGWPHYIKSVAIDGNEEVSAKGLVCLVLIDRKPPMRPGQWKFVVGIDVRRKRDEPRSLSDEEKALNAVLAALGNLKGAARQRVLKTAGDRLKLDLGHVKPRPWHELSDEEKANRWMLQGIYDQPITGRM